ncbi:hypothetical protein EDD22DRAFT_1023316 [Suillus occidentalis]|nr:hypothetical protein EDD22DRAFT_1023316 [Suillus occidentalis]
MDIAEKQQFKQYWGFQSIFVRKTITNVIGILIYDHMVTLPEEITFIWCHPKMLSAMFFLVNRYVALIGNIYGLFIDFLPAASYEMAGSPHISAEVSPLLSEFREFFFFLQQIIVCRGACAGTFSPGDNSHTVIYVLGDDCHNSFTKETYVIPFIGCAPAQESWQSRPLWTGLGRRLARLGDFGRLFSSNRNILDIIFQDGIFFVTLVIYILNQANAGAIAMTLINIPNILTYYCGSDITRGNLATFTSCMSVTLISRLVLNLHKSTDHGIFSTTIRDDGYSLGVFTTRVNLQAITSSHTYQTDFG